MPTTTMITDDEIARFERDGAVVIDGPFVDSPAMLDYLEAGWDRLYDGEVKRTDQPAYAEQAYVDCIGHPFLEAVAKKVLRADEVGLWWGVGQGHARPPWPGPFDSPSEQWASGLHIGEHRNGLQACRRLTQTFAAADIQATMEDFDATPRRARCELWHWVNDVPEHRGAMRAS